MNTCPECGCRTSGGVCSNCQEELYILREQGEFTESVSAEFMAKADEQEKFLQDEGRLNRKPDFNSCPHSGDRKEL
jgi:hypothetical protein